MNTLDQEVRTTLTYPISDRYDVSTWLQAADETGVDVEVIAQNPTPEEIEAAGAAHEANAHLSNTTRFGGVEVSPSGARRTAEQYVANGGAVIRFTFPESRSLSPLYRRQEELSHRAPETPR